MRGVRRILSHSSGCTLSNLGQFTVSMDILTPKSEMHYFFDTSYIDFKKYRDFSHFPRVLRVL